MHPSLGFACLAAVVALLTASGTAQVYSPAPLAHHSGMNVTGYPFGDTRYRRVTYQQVHGDIPSATVINYLAWRPYRTVAAHAAFSATLTMSFGDAGPAPASASATFATNLGANPKKVIDNKTIGIPAYSPPAQPPADFVFRLPLDSAYFYIGTGTLCWDLRCHDHTLARSTAFDMWEHSTTLRVQPGGGGCTASGAGAPMWLGGGHTGSTLRLLTAYGPAGGGAMLMAGFDNTPIDLSAIGAPCALRTDIRALVPGSGSGPTQTWTAPLTVKPANGVVLYVQAAAPDPTANNLGLVFSNGLALIWPYVTPPAVCVYSNVSDTATTGNLLLNYALVVKLGL